MGAALRLVKKRVPKATVRCLETLLDQAISGRVIGIAFIAVLDNGFIADACGQAHNDPENTLRMLQVLIEKVSSRIPS